MSNAGLNKFEGLAFSGCDHFMPNAGLNTFEGLAFNGCDHFMPNAGLNTFEKLAFSETRPLVEMAFNKRIALKTLSDTETLTLGHEMGKALPANSVVCFLGDLGAGKTTLIKGLASAAAGCSPDQVNSPTFVYLNIYPGPKTVYHFDLYRLRDTDEFLSMGFDEYFFAGGICCIEWSERIEAILPSNCLIVTLKHIGEKEREVIIERRL